MHPTCELDCISNRIRQYEFEIKLDFLPPAQKKRRSTDSSSVHNFTAHQVWMLQADTIIMLRFELPDWFGKSLRTFEIWQSSGFCAHFGNLNFTIGSQNPLATCRCIISIIWQCSQRRICAGENVHLTLKHSSSNFWFKEKLIILHTITKRDFWKYKSFFLNHPKLRLNNQRITCPKNPFKDIGLRPDNQLEHPEGESSRVELGKPKIASRVENKEPHVVVLLVGHRAGLVSSFGPPIDGSQIPKP